jgi:phage baseplate assembly protein W
MPYKNLEISNASTVAQSTTKQSQYYKGFSSVGDTSFGTRLYDFDLIRQDIINHFNTRVGERVMNPTFGCIVWDLLMEPLTDSTKEQLTENIKKICTNDPRVVPTQIILNEYESGYLLELTLTMLKTNQSTNMKLQFDQNIGLSLL